MSQDELEQAGILLPREEWGTKEIQTSVPRTPLILISILAPAATILMFTGDGRLMTWIGLGLFLLLLMCFTWLNLKGIK